MTEAGLDCIAIQSLCPRHSQAGRWTGRWACGWARRARAGRAWGARVAAGGSRCWALGAGRAGALQASGARGRSGRLAGGGRAGGHGARGRRTLGRRAGRGRQVSGARAAGARGARGRARQQARERAGQGWLGGRRAAWALGARPGLGLCTRCTRPVFGPVRLGIFLSQICWTLFVNPVHEHCSS